MATVSRAPSLKSPEPVLVVCDLDSTLLGNDAKLKQFFALWEARLSEETAAGNKDGSKLAFATGRCHDSYIPLVEQGVLAAPDVAITYTGADIRIRGDDAAGRRWAAHVAEHWDPEAVHETLKSFGFPLLELSAGRVVYGEHQVPSDAGITPEVLDAMKSAMVAAGIKAEFIKSTHHDGTFLDVLPAGIDKGSAAAFVRDHFNIPFERTIVAGDSWNDWAMMERGGAGRILVGNASEDLVQRCMTDIGKDAMYHAKEFYAGGVIDGCRHYGLFPETDGTLASSDGVAANLQERCQAAISAPVPA